MKKELLFVILFIILCTLFFTVERYDKNKTIVTGDVEKVFVPLDRTKHVYFNQSNENVYPVLASLDLNHGFVGNEYIECKDGGIFNSKIKDKEEYLFNCNIPNNTEKYNKPDCELPEKNRNLLLVKDGKCECPYYSSDYDQTFKQKVGNVCQYDDSMCNNNGNINNEGKCVCGYYINNFGNFKVNYVGDRCQYDNTYCNSILPINSNGICPDFYIQISNLNNLYLGTNSLTYCPTFTLSETPSYIFTIKKIDDVYFYILDLNGNPLEIVTQNSLLTPLSLCKNNYSYILQQKGTTLKTIPIKFRVDNYEGSSFNLRITSEDNTIQDSFMTIGQIGSYYVLYCNELYGTKISFLENAKFKFITNI
jgi:hypothetical protein